METLKSLDSIASQLLAKLPELMREGTLYSTDLFNRFIEYSIVVNSVGVIFLLVVLLLSIYSVHKAFKSYDEYDWQQPVFCIIGVIGIIISTIIISECILNLIQLMYLPELYLIEYFK